MKRPYVNGAGLRLKKYFSNKSVFPLFSSVIHVIIIVSDMTNCKHNQMKACPPHIYNHVHVASPRVWSWQYNAGTTCVEDLTNQ